MRTNINPSLTPDDITDLAALAAKLGKAVNGVFRFIATLFDPQTVSLLLGYASDASVAPALCAALTKDFNAIIHGVPIYDPGHFAEVRLSKRTNRLLKEQPKGPSLARFHRLLLEDIFREEIAQSFHDKREQKWINLKGGLRRFKGAKGIHGRAKIKGNEYRKCFHTDNVDKARQEYHEWVADLRKSLNWCCRTEESLVSFVEPYLASRQQEVVLKKIKPGTISALRKTYKSLG